jgi:hypothetical protein
MVWMEGINDLGQKAGSHETVIAGYKAGVAQARARNIKVVGGTLTSSLNSTNASYSTPEVNAQRRLINEFIRTAGAFDGVAD